MKPFLDHDFDPKSQSKQNSRDAKSVRKETAMKKINLRALLFGFVFASIGVALAVTVTIPNTFASGEVVSASKINANFTTLQTGMNTLETGLSGKQARVTGVCDAGKAMKEVKIDGTVTCEPLGAGVKASFYHVAQVADLAHGVNGNIIGNRTCFSNTFANSNPRALISVTPVYGTGVYNPNPIGIVYDVGRNEWCVFNSNATTMPNQTAFNIFVY